VELVVEVEEAVVLVAVAAVVAVAAAASFPGISLLALGVAPDVLTASEHAYLP
jgi:hypothetical protein